MQCSRFPDKEGSSVESSKLSELLGKDIHEEKSGSLKDRTEKELVVEISKKDGRKVDTLVEVGTVQSKKKKNERILDESESIMCRKGCGLSMKREMKKTHSCVYELHQIIKKQSCEQQELRENLKKLRKYCRTQVKRSREKETQWRAGIEEKIIALSNDLHKLDIRRCQGKCKKHVKTEKCLCQGFSILPHVCCGKEGGLCDC